MTNAMKNLDELLLRYGVRDDRLRLELQMLILEAEKEQIKEDYKDIRGIGGGES